MDLYGCAASFSARARYRRPLLAAFCVACAVAASPALGAAGADPAPGGMDDLVQRLGSRKAHERIAARDQLIGSGAEAVPALLRGMKNYGRRERLLQMIAAMGERAVPTLLTLLEDAQLGGDAGTALARAAGPDSAAHIPEFLACLRKDPSRSGCGIALARSARKAGAHRADLLKAAKDPVVEVRVYACTALAELGGEGSVAALAAALKDGAAPVRASAAAALNRLGSAARSARPALQAAAEDADADVRFQVRQALRSTGA